MKRAKVDHAYQHVIKTEDVLLLLLEHCIIECTRILRITIVGVFVFFTKKQQIKNTPIPKQTNQ